MARLAIIAAVSLLYGITMADDFRSIVNEVFMSTNQLDMQRLHDQLLGHEGEVFTCYHDSLGYPTVGRGHLITTADVIEVGDTISKAHSDRLFERDVNTAISDCRKLYAQFDTFPLICKEALINMTYNMGYTKMHSFNGFNALVIGENWGMVADFLRNNFKRWYAQVKGRAKDVEGMFRQAARGI